MSVYRGGALPKPDKEFIKEFKELGGFDDTYKFVRSDRVTGRSGYKTHWWVECPFCKEDVYTKNGFSYIFEDSTSRLKKGLLSCRCSSSYQKTSEEYYFELEKIRASKKPEVVLLTTPTEIVSASHKIKWKCAYGHVNYSAISSLRKHEYGCNKCRMHDSYYRKEEEGSCRYLYVITGSIDGEGFVKVGMTKKLYGRNGRLTNLSLSCAGVKIEGLYRGKYEDVFKLESYLHKNLHSEVGNMVIRENLGGRQEFYKRVYLSYILAYVRQESFAYKLNPEDF